jgi:hypothetical protein
MNGAKVTISCYWVLGTWYWVLGTWYLVQDSILVCCFTQRPAPSTL